jgi:hypothetical protein
MLNFNMLNVIMLRSIMSNVANNPFMLSVVRLSVVMLSVVMLSVVAPHCSLTKGKMQILNCYFSNFLQEKFLLGYVLFFIFKCNSLFF